MRSGADLGEGGGGGGDAPPPSGIRPLPTQRVPLLYYFSNIHFWRWTLKILMGPLAPIYTNFEGEMLAEKSRFFGRNFPKSA